MQPSYLRYIGIQNFRIFSKYTDFDFRPITVLTGKNSSGKSSLIKALLLFKETFETINNLNILQFESANLGSFSNNVSRGNLKQKNSMVFSFEISFPFLEDEFLLTFHFFNPNNTNSPMAATYPKEIRVVRRKDEKVVFSFKDGDWDSTDGQQYLISYDLNDIFSECYDKMVTYIVNSAEKPKTKINPDAWMDEIVKEIEQQKKLRKDPQFHSTSKTFDSKRALQDLQPETIKLISDHIKSKEPLFRCISDLVEIPFSKKEKEILKPIDYLSNLGEPIVFWQAMSPDIYGSMGYHNIFIRVSEYFDYVFTRAEDIQTEKIQEVLGMQGHYAKINEVVKIVLINGFLKPIENFEKWLSSTLKATHHLPPSRLNHERVNMIKGNTVVKSMIEFDENKFLGFQSGQEFLKYAIDLFEIPGIPVVRTFEGQAAAIHIQNEGVESSLADYGFGFSQLIPLVITIYNTAKSSLDDFDSNETFFTNSIIIIEEPEANLHPNFQSKIADLISEASRCFGIQFIIETHSEYIIRKLQYLTAKKEIKPSDTAIYYFSNPLKLKKGEEQIKRMNIRKDGFIDEDFGEGFFDESTRLTLELLKLQSLN